ncbi:hypothetical protein AOLI_G00047250 [Acnodon oligacanthus]
MRFVVEASLLNLYQRFYLLQPSFHCCFWFTTDQEVSQGGRGCWSLSQWSSGGRQDTPWTGCQSIAGLVKDSTVHEESVFTNCK